MVFSVEKNIFFFNLGFSTFAMVTSMFLLSSDGQSQIVVVVVLL